MYFFPVELVILGKSYIVPAINILKNFLTVFSGFENRYVPAPQNFSNFF